MIEAETAETAPRERPSPAALHEAATVLMSRHVAVLRAAARPYARTPEDLEDAVQRGVEILLVKAPTTDVDELLPWLRTVVKHEAIAIWRRDRRMLPSEELDESDVTAEPSLQDRIDDRSDFDEGVEALARLKPDEMRCLLLKAAGLSYDEICTETEFSYTKVNRCLTEGRASFRRRLHGIRSGQECERLAPLLSRAADGEATHDDLRVLRPHLRRCSVCKATLREFRAVPNRVAALVPPLALTAGRHRAAALVARAIGWVHRRSAAVAFERIGIPHAAAASTAVFIAAGGAAVVAHPTGPHIGRTAKSPAVVAATTGHASHSQPAFVVASGTERHLRHLHRARTPRRAHLHAASSATLTPAATAVHPSSIAPATIRTQTPSTTPSPRQPVEFGP